MIFIPHLPIYQRQVQDLVVHHYRGIGGPLQCALVNSADKVIGLHMNPEGYQVLYDEILKVIDKYWPDQVPERMERWFPDHSVAPIS